MDVLNMLVYLAAAVSLGVFSDVLSEASTLGLVIGVGSAAITYGGFRLMLLVADRTTAARDRVSVIVLLYVTVNAAILFIVLPVFRPDVSIGVFALIYLPIAALISIQLYRWKTRSVNTSS